MGKIKIEDLTEMSNEDIRDYLLTDKVCLLSDKIKDYLDVDITITENYFLLNTRLNRVKKFLDIIIVERFLKREL